MNLIGGMSNCGEGGEDPYRFRTRGQGRDDKNSQDQADRLGPLRRHARVPGLRRRAPDQDGPGLQARRGRPAARPQGVGRDRPPAPHPARRRPHLAPAAPRHLLDRGPGPAHLRPQAGQRRRGVGEAGRRGRRGHHRRRRASRRWPTSCTSRGQNGGTGASPLSSIKHAGMPWELGLADTQRALVDNGLRGRVRVRVDGGFMTGRQVIVAALLGADEYQLRHRGHDRRGLHHAAGLPPRHLQAGRRHPAAPPAGQLHRHARGRRRLLPVHRRGGAAATWPRSGCARSTRPSAGSTACASARRATPARRRHGPVAPAGARRRPTAPRHFVERVELQDPRSDLGDQLLADAFRPIWDGDDVDLAYAITNADRAIGAALVGRHRPRVRRRCRRGARPGCGSPAPPGQSFGAFLTHGVELELDGEANDYVGKGMGGGRIVIRPPAERRARRAPVLAGNTCLYGATGGELFIAGAVGERFAVRNSGATAVVEGVGDHCCEYMTGGTVVVARARRLQPRRRHDRRPGLRVGPRRRAPDRPAQHRPGRGRAARRRRTSRRCAGWSSGTPSSPARAAPPLLLDHWAKAVGHLWHVLPKDEVRRIEGRQAGRVVSA